eukprot:s6433_g6.t1
MNPCALGAKTRAAPAAGLPGQAHRLRAASGPGCVQPLFLRSSSLALALRTAQFRRSQARLGRFRARFRV